MIFVVSAVEVVAAGSAAEYGIVAVVATSMVVRMVAKVAQLAPAEAGTVGEVVVIATTLGMA